MSLQFTPHNPPAPGEAPHRPIPPRGESYAPAFPSDLAMTQYPSHSHGGPGSAGGSQPASQSNSRRPSMHGGHPGMGIFQPLPMSLSRRSSLASGPRPITRAEYSGPHTPSLLSRAGSPVLPLAAEGTRSRQHSFSGRDARHGAFIGSLDCGTTSTRFIVFDEYAKIICEHQAEFPQILPHAGWHEQDPLKLVECMKECITKAVEQLEWMGWHRDSIKGIGITNQRETTLAWSRTTGKPLCNAIVWDDARTKGLVRQYETKLEEEGLEIDDDEEDAEAGSGADAGANANATAGTENETEGEQANGEAKLPEDVELGPGGAEAAFADEGKVEGDKSGLVGQVGKAIQGLGLGGEGVKGEKRRRKGMDGLVDVTGIRLSTYFSAIKLRWMIDHHKEVHEAHESDDLAFGTVDSWLVYNLTGALDGGLHIMDVTNASRTLLISLRTLAWHAPLLRFFGLRPSILPRIVSSAEVYGTIHANLGLPLTGVPIAGIVGDQQAALVGNKCLSRGEAKNTYGTGSFVLFNTGHEAVRSKNGLLSTVAFKPGPDAKPVYALEGSIAVAGSAIKWLRDQMNLIEESSEMDHLAGSVKDTGGVYFVTAFSGLLAPYWDREAAGTIIGLTSYTTSAHIARATLEAVCFQTRAVLDVIEAESGVTLSTLKVDGGVTNSDLAMQLQANIGGFKVSRPTMRESTALGSALLAGHALGLFGWDLTRPETLERVNTADVYTFEPELPEKERLKAIRGWEKAVGRARSWFEVEEEDEEEARAEEEEGAVGA